MKRRALQVIVFLLLGAIVNVAVAWGCVSTASNWSPTISVDVPSVEQRHWWEQRQPKVHLTGMYLYSGFGVDNEFYYVSNSSFASAQRMRVGVPALSLEGVEHVDLNGAVCGSTFLDAGRLGLPYRPIWRGFAINTISYAAVLWVMFFAAFALRRRLRIRRGLCPACAYPIGSSPVCTECGAKLSKQAQPRRGDGM